MWGDIFLLVAGIYLIIGGIYKIRRCEVIDIEVNKFFYNFIVIKDKKKYCKLLGQSRCFSLICLLIICFIGCKLEIISVIYTFGLIFVIGKIYFFIRFMKVIGLK
ncbi:hypothetical protein [Tepidibacter hydrothermalis]|uniref:DUF3784 domain-containing protein n=1 Tax=Tepidibacter hydrothermalis TaxID=3036126 RepID=A0ABY8E9F2_9FIRM|nr:hypothetical protein [Tepidibacter hydrothermalis]WFD09504.1 hypothetical protein P4S50_14065 [Tepidibacter hydrothermalis]